MIIAIDGPAGSGKSSTAREVARRLGFVHLDTGAMYRAVTLKALRQGVAVDDVQGLGALMGSTGISFAGAVPDTRILLDGEDVSEAVRGNEVTARVSDYCAVPLVREELVRLQRATGERSPCVCEGRDIGTVVFPGAALKVYMDATVDERARRRQRDFAAAGSTRTLNELVEAIRLRDHKDSTRANSPLCRAADAVVVDTTALTFEEQVEQILSLARARGAGGAAV